MKSIIKKAAILFSLILALSAANAQYVSIPDTNFGTWLDTSGYHSCMTGNNTSGWRLDTTCTAVLSATTIICKNMGIRDVTGLQYFKTITYLDCSDNDFSTLPALSDSLNYLICVGSGVTNLPDLPPFLRELNCNFNQVASLPNLPSSLTLLNCGGNQLHTLPSLPASLTNLDCSANYLYSPPVLPASLTILNCAADNLTTLPILPAQLTYLVCYNNPVHSLPSLPTSLAYLDCRVDSLSSLPSLPASLAYLDCGFNQLTSLPSLPSPLAYLECFNNQLPSLPNLPSLLNHLGFGQNQLTNLPILPNSLTYLDCEDNQLTSITSLPDSLMFFDCIGNIWLTCLPAVLPPFLNTIGIDSTAIGCMPSRLVNYVYYGNLDPNTLPICTPGNALGCPVYIPAGPNQTICQNSTARMAALGSGTWSALASNPAIVTIDTVSSPTTPMSGFNAAGTYGFIWTTSSDSDTMTVTVNTNPIANYGLPSLSDTSFPCAPVPLCLTDSSIGNIVHYSWNFGDGSQLDTVPNECHIWSSPGYYPITETIISNNGCADSITKYTIHIGGPTVSITSRVTPSCHCTSVTYYITTVGADSLTFTSDGGSPLFESIPVAVGTVGNPTLDSLTVVYCNGGSINPYVRAFSSSCQSGYYGLSAPITLTPALSLTDSVTNASCSGSSNGSICVTVTGGTPGYTYQWNFGTPPFFNCINNVPRGSYCVTVTDNHACTASICDTLTQPTAIIITDSVINASCPGCSDGSIITNVLGGSPAYSYNWSNQVCCNHSNLLALDSGTYCLTVTDGHACTATICDTVGSGHEYVWPGDADNNRIVNNADLLPIGLGFDTTGPVRAVQGIVWQGDAAADWADSFSSYTPVVNFKHADCNGDGIINSADTVAIMANFSLTHAKTGPMLSPWRNGIPAIKAVVSPDTAYTGDTLNVTFVLGDSNTVVNNFYGIAFTYNYDPRIMDSTYTPRMGFLPTSWIGTPSQKISINKIGTNSGQIQAAVTRINHTGVSGHGAIATASFKITTDNISGKNYSYYTNKWSITDVIAIDQYGDPIPLNAGADSSTVGFYPTGIREVTTETLHIQPNPARDKVLISAGNVIKEISLSNIMGQQVMDKNTANNRAVSLDISGLESGVYVVQVKTDKGTGIAKLIIEK